MACETKVVGSLSYERCMEKAWAQRNSDGKAMNQAPPTFTRTEVTLEEDDLETPAGRPTDAHATRHVHVWNVEEPEE